MASGDLSRRARPIATADAPDAPGNLVAPLSRALDRWGARLALALSTLLTAAIYGPALRFAFTFDDPLDLPRAEGRSIWSLFTSSEGYAYYRPIPFVIWKILRGIQGRYSEATLHGLTLACHILAAWLLYLLLRRLTDTHWGLLASILFITYPFSYQAAFGAHTLFHPLMTAMLLLALVLYWDARVGSGGWSVERGAWAGAPPRSITNASLLLALSLLATLVALWTHESGVVIVPLILGLELLILFRARSTRSLAHSLTLSRPSWWPLLHCAAAALFLLVWRAVPKFDRPEPWTRDSLLPNGRYFLQGVVWPVAAQLNGLGARFHFDPVRALWPASALTLVALIALCVAGRQPWSPLVALGATAAILVPAWALLTWAYVEDAPRLLYPAAPAIAALWAMLPALRFPSRAFTAGWRVVTVALLLAVVAQNLAFIGVRRDMWAEGTTLVHAVADTAAPYGDRPTLFLNVPAWFAPKHPEYPVGHVGLTALPGYVGLGRSVYIHRGVQPPVESRGYYPDVNGWKYDFNTHGGPASLDDFAALLRRVDAVYLVEMLPSGAHIREVGALAPGAADPAAPGPRFGEAIALTNATLGIDGDALTADLTWSVVVPVPGDVLPVLRLRDDRGQVAAEWRAYPIADIAAPRLWRPGDRIHDLPRLRLPSPLPGGTYTLWLSWEEKTTKAPLPGTAADGTSLPSEGLPLGDFIAP